MSMAIEPDFDLRELLEIAAGNDFVIQFSPMLRGPGGQQGGTIIRKDVAWSGLTKNDDESLTEYRDRLEEHGFDDISRGIGKVGGDSNLRGEMKNSSGLAVIQEGNGEPYPVPASLVPVINKFDTDTSVESTGHSNFEEAMQAAINDGARRLERPTVY